MGAGSKIPTPAQKKQYYEATHPQEKRHINCSYHAPRVKRDYGTLHFLNTGEPYQILQCPECERYYLREL